MGWRSTMETPDNSDNSEDSGEAFTDADFDDFDEDDVIPINESTGIPVNDTVNMDVQRLVSVTDGAAEKDESLHTNGLIEHINGSRNGDYNNSSDIDSMSANENGADLRRESSVELSPSIVGILGDQHNHAEQRLAARRAARAEAREIRMRELERQQREQENHADKAYDMYAESVGRRGGAAGAGARLAALGPAALHSPRRSSEDSVDDVLSLKDLRHDLKEMEEKFRKAMILNAQLDNDKAASKYQLELLRDRIEELHEEYAQLQREHKEKCSMYERLKREHASTERELCGARAGVRARDAAAARAGRAFVDAAEHAPEHAAEHAAEPALELVSLEAEQLLNNAGEGTLDVRLQKLLNSKQSLESEVRKLKLQLNEERAARHNGAAARHDQEYLDEVESLRKGVCEAKARAARAEAEAALQAAGAARLEAQVARLKARHDQQDEHEDHLKHERRRLQREAREALIRVEELETENSHLTKRLDKLKNAKSALLKDL